MSRRIPYLACTLLGLLTIAVLGGCQNGFTGVVNLSISGVPLQGTQDVVLAIKGVELGAVDGGQTDLSFGSEELVDIEAGRTVILGGAAMPVGDYRWTRLEINPDDSYVIGSDGARYPLKVASLYQSDGDFTVGEGLTVNMLVDIDLRTALSLETQAGVRQYTLHSISRLVDLKAVGNITGTIPTSFVVGSLSVGDTRCDPQVYAFAGRDVVPEGYFVGVKGGTAPFASAGLTLNVRQDIYGFNISLLPAGDYTVAVTCASADTPGSAGIAFSPTQTAQVSVGHSSPVTF